MYFCKTSEYHQSPQFLLNQRGRQMNPTAQALGSHKSLRAADPTLPTRGGARSVSRVTRPRSGPGQRSHSVPRRNQDATPRTSQRLHPQTLVPVQSRTRRVSHCTPQFGELTVLDSLCQPVSENTSRANNQITNVNSQNNRKCLCKSTYSSVYL